MGLYVFLVERIHVVRAPFVNRRNDKIYLGCMIMIVITYGSVTINAYCNHTVEFRASDGRCHFGIRGAVSIPFTVVNFFTDTVLTAVLFYLLRPVGQVPGVSALSRIFKAKSNQGEDTVYVGNDTPARKNIRMLLWKSIVGSLLIEIPMAANMIQFVLTTGEELGMICLTICLVDVCWDALVIHWLTFSTSGSAAEKDLSRLMVVSNEDSSLSHVSVRGRSRPSIREEANSAAQNTAEKTNDLQLDVIEFLWESPRDSTTDLIRPTAVKR
ncbi:hypothetical protein G6011_09747 [Alternaria panax]|uniref:Uncharacterized protein n=1 Tax=Alternaria panax TaxID=48097 RepID=A0AAD4FA88_9PLEO|nr:hypothetical protein G6011_09747 [Alternaria panax]